MVARMRTQPFRRGLAALLLTAAAPLAVQAEALPQSSSGQSSRDQSSRDQSSRDQGAGSQTDAAAPPLYLELRGPAGWRSTFLPTNLGSLLASEASQPLLEMVQGPMQAMLQAAFPAADARQTAQARLLDYDGLLRIAMPDPEAEPPTFHVTLCPDGKTDLGALAKDLVTLAGTSGMGRLVGATDSLPARLQLPESMYMSEFQRASDADPHSCWVAAIAPEDQLATALAAASSAAVHAMAQRAGPTTPAMLLHLDLAQWLAPELAGDATNAAEMRAFGLDSLRDFDLTVAAAGPHVQIEARQGFAGPERGVFGVLFPDRQGVPALLGLRPEQATISKVGRCDFAAIAGVARKLDATFRADRDEDDDLPPAIFDEEQGLLSALADEYAFFATPESMQDYEDGAFDYALAVRLRPGSGFADKWQMARKDLGVRELESEDLGDGYQRQRLSVLFSSFELMVGPDLAVLGYGRNGKDLVAAILEQHKKNAADAKAPETPASLRRHAPAGLNGTAAGSLPMILAQVVPVASMGMGTLPILPGSPALEEDLDLESLEALLKQHRLDVAQSLTGYDKDTWRLRILW